MGKKLLKAAIVATLLGVAGTASAGVIRSESQNSYKPTYSWSGYSNPYQGRGVLISTLIARWQAHIWTNFKPVRAVPEPGSLALLGAGILAMGFAARRRKTAV